MKSTNHLLFEVTLKYEFHTFFVKFLTEQLLECSKACVSCTGVIANFLSTSHALLFQFIVKKVENEICMLQACTTYSPGAACGPRRLSQV